MSNTKYRITVALDQDAEDPSDYSLFMVASFNNRHGSYQDPDKWLPCRHEDDEGYPCDQMPWQHSYGELADMGRYQQRYGSNPDAEWIKDHEYLPDPDIVGVLSYFEHSLCRWGLEGTMYGTPDFRWDGTGLAGVLLWDGTKEEREWWDAQDKAERTKMMEAFLDEYTSWCNGEVFFAAFEKWVERDPDPCPTCHRPRQESQWEDVEAFGGIIGQTYFEDVCKQWAVAEGIDVADIEIVEDF